MDAKNRQKALDEISADDLEKIKAHQASTKGSVPVDEEWMLLGEFALSYGWQAYLDVKADKIKLDEMLTLIEVARKLRARDNYNSALTAFIGAVSSRVKKPTSTFNSLIKIFTKELRLQ